MSTSYSDMLTLKAGHSMSAAKLLILSEDAGTAWSGTVYNEVQAQIHTTPEPCVKTEENF